MPATAMTAGAFPLIGPAQINGASYLPNKRPTTTHDTPTKAE
jgi:hypothetical protein